MGVLPRCVSRVPCIFEASFHPVDEFREPAKTLFNAGLARFTGQEIAGLAESWQHKRERLGSLFEQGLTKAPVPCLQPDVEKPSLTSVVATFICGSIAVEKYSLLSPRFAPSLHVQRGADITMKLSYRHIKVYFGVSPR